jgi:hypothetical protein
MILAAVNEAGQHVSLFQDTVGVLTDPAHVIAELVISVVFELLQALAVIWLWKRIVKPRLTKAVHAEVDAEHGVTHHDDHTHPYELSQWTDDDFRRCR